MSGGGGSSKTVSQQELSPEQQRLLGLVLPAAEDYMKTPLKQYPGSTIPDVTKMQKTARKDLNKQANVVGGLSRKSIDSSRKLIGMGQGTYNLGSGGLGSILSDYQRQGGSRDFLASGALLNPNTNPVLKQMTSAALRPITNQLQRNILPGIRSDFAGGNSFGSSRQGIAEGIALGDYAKTAADTTANIQNNAFNQGLQAMTQTVGQGTQAATTGSGFGLSAGADTALRALMASPELAQLAFLPGMVKEGIGMSQQQQQGAKLAEKAQKYTTRQMLPFLQAQDVAQLAFGMGGGSTTTSGMQNQNVGVGQTLGGLGMMLMAMKGLGALGPLAALSDRRLKRDIEFMPTQGRYKWYSFNYITDPIGSVKRLGVMADEVEQITPEAVFTDDVGFKHVDYGRLGL